MKPETRSTIDRLDELEFRMPHFSADGCRAEMEMMLAAIRDLTAENEAAHAQLDIMGVPREGMLADRIEFLRAHECFAECIASCREPLGVETCLEVPDAVRRLKADNEVLRSALRQARKDIERWGKCAPFYLQAVHAPQGDLDRIDAALRNAPQGARVDIDLLAPYAKNTTGKITWCA